MKSIQTKILMVVISGLLVITAIVSTIAVNMTHEIMHKDADRILSNVAEKEVAYINDVLGDIKKSATIMQHYAKAEVEDINDLKNAEFLKTYLQKNKKMFSEIAINTNGVQGYFMRLNPEYTDSKTGFYNIINEDFTVREMPVTDLSKYHKNDVKNVGWYYTAVKEGKAVWLEPYYFPGYEEKLISYTIPVYINSKLLGVIGFDMDFGYFIDKINGISVYENGYAVLLSSDGKTIYNEINDKDSGNPHTEATATLQNGMHLELRADYKDIQKDIHPMLFKIVMAFIVVLIFSIIYTIFVTYRIVRPLKQLTSVAKNLSDGLDESKLSKISVSSKDEIGTLSVVLKDTYKKIHEYTTYINALAYRDSLTGVKNSTAYTEAISAINKDINCDNPHFGVLVADINNLKQTNDKYGHDIGNELIIYTSKILTDIFKESLVFRIGGDEFVVILKNNDYKDYRNLLVKFDTVCSENFINVHDNKIPISIARGVALYNPDVDRVYEDVFTNADHLMYFNKEEHKKLAKD